MGVFLRHDGGIVQPLRPLCSLRHWVRVRPRTAVAGALLLAAGTAAPAAAATIVARLAAPAAPILPGSEFAVEVTVDLSAHPELLGAYQAALTWDPAALELVEVLDGETAAFAAPQTRIRTGELAFSQFNVQGAGGVVSLLKVRFRATGRAAGTVALDLSFAVLDAAWTFTDLLPSLRIESAFVSAVMPASWGQVKGGQGRESAGRGCSTGRD